ncbi:MAG: alanine racemase [Nitrococcus mobilis]|nr:alanine racemase [Nitrococcus mobilis]
MTRLARATVDLGALRHNLAVARQSAPGARVIAVLKANGYGHGLLQAAAALAQADAFAVSCMTEASRLRLAGYRHRIILLAGYFERDELPLFDRYALDPVIHAEWQMALLERSALYRPLDVWLKVDTGMHRLGFPAGQVREVYQRLRSMPSVASIRFMTHLARADNRRDPTTRVQLEAFEAACQGLPGERSIANSAATLAWPQTHAQWVRPGIMLYGCSPFIDGLESPALRPVQTLEARLLAINYHRQGDLIGYGGIYACPETMPVGVVSIGYGDGYPRHAPSGTPLLVAGREVSLVGRVSMDMLCVDLRSAPHARVGDPVVLWGEDLPVERVAERCGTIAYELLCKLTSRVQFRYMNRPPNMGET